VLVKLPGSFTVEALQCKADTGRICRQSISPKFYENPSLYAFPLELFFMAERFKQMKDLLQQKDMFQSLTISDYLFTKCLLFAK
jgi:deoxyadenosine/deoxycytidine kinase